VWRGAADLGKVLSEPQTPLEIEGRLLSGLLAEQANAAASRAVTYSGSSFREPTILIDRFACRNLITGGVSGLQKLVSDGDVVEMEDTLVLETSAFVHESSNLSIPTRDLWRRGRVV
jgi:hypothetical protein